MKKLLSFLLLILTCTLLGWHPTPARADEAFDTLVKQGDVHDVKFEPEQALGFYLPAEKMQPENVALLLSIARQYRHKAADSKTLAEKIKLGHMAKEYAKRARALDPKNSETHLSVAISYAKMSSVLTSKEKVEASREIKKSVDEVIKMDPKQDLAWHLLGGWHQRLAELGTVKRALARVLYGELPAASNEESVKCFQKAVELNPNRLIHHIELGRTYAQMGNAAEAKKWIEKGLAMPNTGKDDPEVKQRGRDTLDTLK
jgi:tetratricopeptide (TPR) repeat protein